MAQWVLFPPKLPFLFEKAISVVTTVAEGLCLFCFRRQQKRSVTAPLIRRGRLKKTTSPRTALIDGFGAEQKKSIFSSENVKSFVQNGETDYGAALLGHSVTIYFVTKLAIYN